MSRLNRTEIVHLSSEVANSAKDFQSWNNNSYFCQRVTGVAKIISDTLITHEVEVEYEGRTLQEAIEVFCIATLREPRHFVRAGHELALKVADGRSTSEERGRLLLLYRAVKDSFDYVLGR